MNENGFWSFLEARRLKKAINRATGRGAYTGGGLAFAKALQASVGGTLVSLADQEGALHPVLDVGGMLVDFEGPAPSADDMLRRAGWWLGINYDRDSGQAARPDRVCAFREEDYRQDLAPTQAIEDIRRVLPKNLGRRLEAAATSFGISLSRVPQAPASTRPAMRA